MTDDGLMRQAIRVISVLSFIAVPILAASTAQAQEALLNTVTVAAFKTVDIEADTGHAAFGVRSESRSARTATEKLSAKTDSVLRSLRDAGFTNDELSTGNINLRRQCIRKCIDPNPRDRVLPERIMGYVGSATVFLETNRLNRLGPAVDAAVAGGAQSIRNISFDVEDKDAAVLEALRQAMQFAKAKAQIIAEEAGRTLGPALIVEEGRTSAPREHRLLEDSVVGSIVEADGASAAIPFPVDPPTLNASARVTVTWELL